jgi:catechol 2,3-dioxygenase-like lactoylglutathione lyase family enzyme
MIQRFDHVTIVVRDLDQARRFFGLLGFTEDKAVVIKGPLMDAYMGVPGIEADHVTLVLRDVMPRLEVQLLRYRHPEPLADANIERLEKVGFNHVCFAVDDIEAEVARLRGHGIAMRNELMDFSLAQADLPQRAGRHHGRAVRVGEPGRLAAFGGRGYASVPSDFGPATA